MRRSPKRGHRVRDSPRPWRLYLPSIAGPVLETGFLLWFGAPSAAALGPQVTAPVPFDLFHDLRWISVYHSNWLAFGAEIMAMLLVRSAYATWLVRTVQPGMNLKFLPAFVRALIFYSLATLLLVPWVVLVFGFAFTGLSWLFLVAIPPMLAIALVIHRGASTMAAGEGWDWRPRASSIVWIACSFIWLSAAGAIISKALPPLGLAAAGAAGMLNGRAAHAIAGPTPRNVSGRRRWFVPASLIGIFSVVIGGAALGFAQVRTPHRGSTATSLPRRGSSKPIIVLSGFNSRSNRIEAFPAPAGYIEWRYSYKGIGPRRSLRPYGPRDTLQSIEVSARRLARQIHLLRSIYDNRVSIVAESEGALIARYFLTQIYRPESHAIDSVVLLDMPPVDSTTYYPPSRSRDGWGVASRWGLRGLTDLVEGLGPLNVSADAPMLRPLADCPEIAHQVMTRRAPEGIDEVAFLAIGDAMDGTAAVPSGAPTYVAMAHHGGLIRQPSVQRAIRDVLTGASVAPDVRRLEFVDVVSALSNAWHAPGLLPGTGPTRDC